MMTTMFALVPVLICAALMFGGGVAAWFTARTPLRRLSSSRRRTDAPPRSGASQPAA